MNKSLFVTFVILACLTLLLCIGNDQARAQKTANEFPLERDHVFVWVSKDAPEAAVLEKLGLYTDRRVSRHTGQGTASIAFFFESAYLELIWVADESEASKKDVEAGDMAEHIVDRSRWRQTGASPFGIGLHRRPGTNVIPFPTRKERSEYMKPGTFFEIALSSSILSEPMLFVAPDTNAFPTPEEWKAIFEKRPERRKMFVHPLGVKKLTGVKITLSGVKQLSEAASMLSKNGVVKFEKGKAPLLELTFDDGSQGKSLDARPTLPIVLKY